MRLQHSSGAGAGRRRAGRVRRGRRGAAGAAGEGAEGACERGVRAAGEGSARIRRLGLVGGACGAVGCGMLRAAVGGSRDVRGIVGHRLRGGGGGAREVGRVRCGRRGCGSGIGGGGPRCAAYEAGADRRCAAQVPAVEECRALPRSACCACPPWRAQHALRCRGARVSEAVLGRPSSAPRPAIAPHRVSVRRGTWAVWCALPGHVRGHCTGGP
jgi:hypothetical protein